MQILGHGRWIGALRTAAACVVVGAGLSGCNRNISDKKIDFIDLSRTVELYEEGVEDGEAVLFIDARNPERFAAGHIKGARNIRVNEINPDYDPDPALLKYKNLVVYGENPASATARVMAKRLIQGGYNTILRDRVRLFTGGWVVWYESGLPIEADEVPEQAGSTPDGTDPEENEETP
jgi:rhodanese-related sulfurtransferase